MIADTDSHVQGGLMSHRTPVPTALGGTLLASFALAVVGVLLAPTAAHAQLPSDPVERARVIAEIMQFNASQITIFDRAAKPITEVGDRALQGRPVLSPDGERIAVVRNDLETETADVWVLDVATGAGTRLTMNKPREFANGPAWSPDGNEIGYVALRGGYYGLYRQPWNGKGSEELLHQSSAPITLTEWSTDGRYLGYFSNDLTGGALYALPLEGERTPIDIFRSERQLAGVHFSPDMRYIAYVSNDTGRSELYVRPFTNAAGAEQQQVSRDGAQGLGFWRDDGKELFYLAANRSIMAVPVTSRGSGLEFGEPAVLFRAPDSLQLSVGNTSIRQDGERFVIAVPPPLLLQLTMYDRQGELVSKVGAPGVIVNPKLSPDGARIVATVNDLQSGSNDIWTFDVATGKVTAITSTPTPENGPLWSPDGKEVAYVGIRESFSSIYRKRADGTGDEEMLFRYTPGAFMGLTDWSRDGKFMTFVTGVLVIVPIGADQDPLDRKEIDWLREEYDVNESRFSPDGRFIAYLSNEANPDWMDVYVRAFDPDKPEAPPPGDVLRVSMNGTNGMVSWRQDTKEMYFLSRDWEVMAVDITTTPTLQAGTPRVLFKLPGPLAGNGDVSQDGERFLFALPVR
jgi:Tol biopolymer transport system component